MTDHSPSLARLEHTREELVRAQWTQWRSFLQSHLQLLDARAAENQMADPFEHDPQGAASREADALSQLAALDPQRRALFEQVYEQARQEAQSRAEQQRAALPAAERGRPLDPDTIDRGVLQALLDDAEGRGSRAPKGRVPIEPGTWWVVEAQTFLAAPKLDAYTIAGSRRARGKLSAYAGVAGMLVVGVVALLVYLFWPSGKPVLATTNQPVLAAGAPVPAWPLRAVQLVTASTSTTLTLDPQHSTGCTGLAGEARGAGFQTGAALPLHICVRGVAMPDVTEVLLFAQGDQPVRRYTRTASPRPDLELSVPNGVGWLGALRDTQPTADLRIGASAELGGAVAQVVTISAVGTAEDPSLPAEQMRVTVVVSAASGAPDWPTLAPTLLTARGDVLETSGTTATPAGAALSYVLPLIDEPTDVVWRVNRADGSVVRWRTTLAPPRDRAAVLRASLQILECHATVAPEDAGAVQLVISVRNNGTIPLTLQAADLEIANGGQLVAIGAVDGLVEPLDPGGTRTLGVRVPAAPGTTLTLTLADQRRSIRR